MLIALSRPHSNIAIPLKCARDFTFSTSLDGDEEGRIVLSPILAKQAVPFQVGDDLSIYCTKLSQTIWRGQIERIEETKDGELIIEALGFGALQREARISVVQNMRDMKRWKPVGAGFMAGSGYDSRGDLWEYEIVSNVILSQTRVRILAKTKKAFTISPTTLFFFAYLYDQPERYATITNEERLSILSLSASGLATGLWVAPVTTIPTPPAYTLSLGTFTAITLITGSVTTSDCYGWVVGVRASGNETTAGTTSVVFDVGINIPVSEISTTALSSALNARGGCCDVYLPSQTNVTIEKPDANLREIIENVNDNVPVAYHKKRFHRDRAKPTIDFRSDSPFVWRFPEKPRIIDISKAPSRVFAQYRGYWSTHLTTTTIPTLESRRQLTQRTAGIGEYGSKTIAETKRDEAAITFERQIAPYSIELDNSRYELMTSTGAMVPNWAADVGDYAIVPNYYQNAKITSRTITRERTTYTVSFNPDDFITTLR